MKYTAIIQLCFAILVQIFRVNYAWSQQELQEIQTRNSVSVVERLVIYLPERIDPRQNGDMPIPADLDALRKNLRNYLEIPLPSTRITTVYGGEIQEAFEQQFQTSIYINQQRRCGV